MVRPMMVKLDATFSLKKLGHASMSKFLSELTALLAEQCSKNDPDLALTKTGVNRLLNTLLRSQAFIVKKTADDDTEWTLRIELRQQHTLIHHLEMFVIHQVMLGGQAFSPETWSQFLYEDKDRSSDFHDLQTFLKLDNYAVRFEPDPQAQCGQTDAE